MTEKRNITYAFDAVELTELRHATSPTMVESALGYLSSWNFTFADVQIFIRDKTDLVAVYRDTPASRPGYVIGAIWHNDDGGGHFSFHS